MVVNRKKTTIDAIDRDILRHMNQVRRNLSGNQISKKINLSPSAIAPRLRNLRNQGIIKPVEIKGMRIFQRKFVTRPKPVNIKAPSKILWGLDIKSRKKR